MTLSANNVFLSCSFDKKDKIIVNFFKAICEGLLLNCTLFDYSADDTPPVKAKELISKTAGIIVIATRRDKLAKGGYTIPSAIREEVAFAFDMNKPRCIFVEKGVKLDGFIKSYSTHISFNREKLIEPEFLTKVLKSLTDFRIKISPQLADMSLHEEPPSFKNEFVNVLFEMEYTEKGFSWKNSMTKQLKFFEKYPFSLPVLIDAEAELKVNENPEVIKYDFAIIKKSKRFKHNIQIDKLTHQCAYFSINFTPVPAKDDFIEYNIKYSSPFLIPIFLDELLMNKPYITINGKRYYCTEGVQPIHTTDKIELQFIFADEYCMDINEIAPVAGNYHVKYYLHNKNELNRIKFNHKYFGNKLIVNYSVKHPTINTFYGIAWTPLKVSNWMQMKTIRNSKNQNYD